MNNPNATSPTYRGAPLEVAVADDVADIQRLIREWLTHAGHKVTCVDNGHELVKLCTARRFDIVITDVMMPESDGFEVVTALKQTCPDLRIVVISGGGRVMAIGDSLRVATRLGADAVLAKPFSGAQLMATIAQIAASLPQAGGHTAAERLAAAG